MHFPTLLCKKCNGPHLCPSSQPGVPSSPDLPCHRMPALHQGYCCPLPPPPTLSLFWVPHCRLSTSLRRLSPGFLNASTCLTVALPLRPITLVLYMIVSPPRGMPPSACAAVITQYQSLIDALNWLAISTTRPDIISMSVSLLAQYDSTASYSCPPPIGC
jgi:hypothetical protein